MQKEPYIKKIVVIDNHLYDVKEIKSASEYNNIKTISESKRQEEEKILAEKNNRILEEKNRSSKEAKYNAYYSKTNLLVVINTIFNSIEYGFIEDNGVFEECENALKDIRVLNVEEILENYELLRKEFENIFGEFYL